MKINQDVLTIDTDTICFIISKAKEFHAKEAVTFPEEMADSEYEYDWSQILADHEDDMTYSEVETIIDDLNVDEQADLLTLMYIGRGDYDIKEWKAANIEAKENLAPNLTGYLLSKPHIADILESALNDLGVSTENDHD